VSNVEPTPQEDRGILYKGKYYKTLDEINQAMQAEGKKIVWNQPGQGPTPGTRYPTPSGETKPVLALTTPKNDASLFQRRLDFRATQDAYKRWAQQADTDIVRPNVWIAGQTPVINIDNVGMWSKAAGASTGSISWELQFTNTPTNQLVGRMASDSFGLIRYPFVFLRENAGKPALQAARYVGDRIAPEWTEDALGYAVTRGEVLGQWFYDEWFKPLIRESAGLLMMPVEIIENFIMTGIFGPIVEANVDEFNTPGAVEKSQASWKERALGIFTNTTYAQYGMTRWRSRDFKGGEGEFKYSPAGEGFVISGEVMQNKNKLEEYLRPTMYGQTATIGRVAASPLVEWGVVQAGDDIHSLVSGLTDAGFQIYADPLAWIQIAKYYKGLGVVAELPTAPATTRQLAKLAKKGVVVDPEVWRDARKAKELIEQAEGLSDDAIDMLQPKQGVVYSGDDVSPGIVRENFLDLDDPAHPRNHGNLLGAGLYVTDAPYVATSYTPRSRIIGLTPEEQAKIGTGTTEIPVAAVEEGAARVYKFELTPEMKIVDTELPYGVVGENQPFGVEQFVQDFMIGYDNAVQFVDNLIAAGLLIPRDEMLNVLEDFFQYRYRDPATFINNASSEPMYRFHQDNPFPTRNGAAGVWDGLLTREYPAAVNFRANWATYFPDFKKEIAETLALGFRTTDDVSGSMNRVQVVLQQVINRLYEDYAYGKLSLAVSKIVRNDPIIKQQLDEVLVAYYGKTFDEIMQGRGVPSGKFTSFIEGRFGSEFDAIRATNAEKLVELVFRYIDPNSTVDLSGVSFGGGQLELVLSAATKVRLWNKSGPSTFVLQNFGDVGSVKNARLVFGESQVGGPGLRLEFDEIAGVKTPMKQTDLGNGRVIEEMDGQILNDWLISKGVDALKYDGGLRIGGYGRHTAHNILRPSKMTMVDQTTGNKIPTNQAVELLEDAKRIKNHAEDLAKARGFASSSGLVDAGSQVGASPTQWEVYKTSGSWKNLSLYLAAENNAYKIWSTVLKRRSPELATRLAKATTPEEVTRLMDVAVYNPDPLNYMRQLPGWSGNLVSEAGFRLKQIVSRESNLFASLPRTPFIAIDDLDEGARHVDDLLQLFRVPFDDRAKITGDFLETASIADASMRKQALFAFARRFESLVLQQRLAPLVKKLGASKAGKDLQDFIDRATRWRRDDIDQLRVFVGDDMMNAVPLPYLDGDGLGPALISELFNSNIALVDPEDINKLVKLFKPWSEMMYSLRRFPGVYEAGKFKDFMRQKALNAQGLWKANVLFGLRYTTRVVADEVMRTTMSGQFRGPFSYVAEIIAGRLNKDIYGRVIPKANEANKIAADLITIRRVSDELDAAIAAGDDVLAARLQKTLDKYDPEEVLMARQNEIESILNDDGVSVLDAMIGRKPGLAYETITRDGTPTYVVGRVQKIVDRDITPREWQRAVADEIVGLSTEADVREVAFALLNGADPSLNSIARWLFEGKGRVYFEKYYKGVDKTPGYNWDTLAEAQKRVELLRDMILRATGGNRSAIKAIAEQRFTLPDGTVRTLGVRTAEGPRATREFRQFLRTDDAVTGEVALYNDPRAPQKAGYWVAQTIQEEKKMRYLFGKWMQYTYGVTSDKMARVPLFQSLKWNKVADMIPMLSVSEARKLARIVLESDLPEGLKARIAANIDRAGAGELTLETLEDFANKWALEDTVNLLFDASKKSNFGRQHAFLFPFFDAFRETAATMLKLGLNPQNIHKVDVARRGLESFRLGGPGESMLFGERDTNADGKQEGFLYTDPGTGKQVLAVPLLGSLASMWSDVPFNLAIPVEGLTMQSNVIPGVGPVVGIAYSALGPQGEDWAWLNKAIFPYGEPGDRTITDYFAPMWFRRIAQGQLADRQAGEALRGLLGDPRQNEVFKYMHSRALQNFAATRVYPPGQAGIEQLAAESYDAALKLWTMRGMAQFFLPAAPITQYYAETNKGLIPLGNILDDIRNTEQQVLKAGGNIADAQEVMINKYGDFIVPYFASLSSSTRAGSEPSTEFESFRANNDYLFEKYPASAGLFFEKTGNYDFEVYALQRQIDERAYLPPRELAQSIDGLMGGIIYRRYERNIPPEIRNTPAGRAILSLKAAEIRKSNPYWNPSLYATERDAEISRQMTEIIAASTDPKLANQPVITTLRNYLSYRDGVIASIRENNPRLAPDGWKTNNGGVLEREVLFMHGEKLVSQNPAFRNLWDNLLSREFERLTPEKLDSLTRTIQTPQEVTTGG